MGNISDKTKLKLLLKNYMIKEQIDNDRYIVENTRCDESYEVDLGQIIEYINDNNDGRD